MPKRHLIFVGRIAWRVINLCFLYLNLILFWVFKCVSIYIWTTLKTHIDFSYSRNNKQHNLKRKKNVFLMFLIFVVIQIPEKPQYSFMYAKESTNIRSVEHLRLIDHIISSYLHISSAIGIIKTSISWRKHYKIKMK